MTIQVDLHLTNAYILNTFACRFEQAELYIKNDTIVHRGKSDLFAAAQTVDMQGKYIAPGLIDAHMHIESSLLAPSEFGRLVLTRGVTRVFADPHEIASVAGVAGLQYMIDEARRSPLHIHYMLPSSVPATSFEHAGAVLHAEQLKPFYDYPEVQGLAEVMDFPAVANEDPDMLQKFADAHAAGRHIDGHGAGLTREQLSIYRMHGIDTDHEADGPLAAANRLAAGFAMFVREGTVERDEVAILPVVNPANQHRVAFCTDDKSAADIQREGSIDYNVALAVQHGMPLTQALTMASYNAANAHHLQNVGALTDGYVADLIVFDSPDHFVVDQVMVAGQWVDFTSLEQKSVTPLANQALNVEIALADFALPLTGSKAHVIQVQPQHITTQHAISEVPVVDGEFVANQQYAKIAVFERYHNLGHSVGIIEGFQLKEGAIAGTIAHDSHNLMVAGVSDEAMLLAAQTLKEIGGGLVVVDGQLNVTTVPLAIGGLMSDEPYEVLIEKTDILNAAFKRISPVEFDPFITLSFMALPVIPSLKITDQGLFDFAKFDFIDINA
ncbi:MAG: adenine deaminase [Lactobacillaceae bacterium]|jgi:adenine deaminase|nr:adenine deaminase [Lactobacillaceae bacterium]